jgi:hypothetical protein
MSATDDDPRARARAEVREAFAASAGEVPERTCPACGATSATRYEDCPACGASFFAPPPRVTRRRRRMLWGAIGAFVAVACAIAIPLFLSDKNDRQARERSALTRAIAAKRAEITRYQQPHDGADRALRPAAGASQAQRLAARAALVKSVEAAITRDAQARVSSGEMDGPISRSECGPFARGADAVPDDRVLSKSIGRYDCVAVKSDVRDKDNGSVGRLGYPFVAALDFNRFSYTWCRNTPPPSEAGKSLVFVRLDRRCLAATGPALGTGYVDVPGS